MFLSVKHLRIVYIIIIHQCLFTFGTDFRQFGVFLDFDSPPLIVCQMPVENIHFVHSQQVDKLVNVVNRYVMTANIQHQSAMSKTGGHLRFLRQGSTNLLFYPLVFRKLPGEQLENSLYTVEKTVRLRGAQRDEVGGDGEFVAFLRHTFFNNKADCRFSVRA